MVMIDIGDPKVARELLCRAQNALIHYKGGYYESELARLEKMIDQIDVLRPLGPDGKHGKRHTDHCGCDGEIDWRPIEGFDQLQVDSTGRVRSKNTGYIYQPLEETGKLPMYTLETWDRRRYKYHPATLTNWAFKQNPTEWPIMKAID